MRQRWALICAVACGCGGDDGGGGGGGVTVTAHVVKGATPSAPGKLSTTMPAGGAQAVMLAPTFGLSAEQTFLTPLVVAEGMTPEISIVMDALHSVSVKVTGGTPTIADGAPITIFPTVGGAA